VSRFLGLSAHSVEAQYRDASERVTRATAKVTHLRLQLDVVSDERLAAEERLQSQVNASKFCAMFLLILLLLLSNKLLHWYNALP